MKFLCRLVLIFCLVTCVDPGSAAAQAFNKAVFYKTMGTTDLNEIEKQIKATESLNADLEKAYKGALLMKKAGMIKGPGKKLNTFKEGHAKLEEAISKDSSNAEWRFLRIIIQEKAPRMLKYYKEIKQDASYLEKHITDLTPDVQAAITDYRKQSDVL